MSKMKFAMAMLAAGGSVGAAMQAQAATVDTLDIPMSQSLTEITVVGSTPQFDFGTVGDSTFFETAFANGGAANSALGIKSSTPGLPAPGETYTKQSYLTGVGGTDLGASGDNSASYIHLTFTSDSTTYIGTAFVDASGELETITYSAVPEPDAWALLIAGAALTGGVLRTARRRQAAMA